MDLGKLNQNDIAVIKISVSEYIKSGYLKFTEDKSVALHNRKSAITLQELLDSRESKFHVEQLRVMYIALLVQQEEFDLAESTGFKDEMASVYRKSLDKLIPKLESIIEPLL